MNARMPRLPQAAVHRVLRTLCFVAVSWLCAGGFLTPVEAEEASIAILVVGADHSPAAEAREKMLFRSLQEARTQAGLTRKDLPIISYHFDKPAERTYCEKQLKIKASSLLFVGIVEHQSLVAQKVRFRQEQVSDAQTAAMHTLEYASKTLGLRPPATLAASPSSAAVPASSSPVSAPASPVPGSSPASPLTAPTPPSPSPSSGAPLTAVTSSPSPVAVSSPGLATVPAASPSPTSKPSPLATTATFPAPLKGSAAPPASGQAPPTSSAPSKPSTHTTAAPTSSPARSTPSKVVPASSKSAPRPTRVGKPLVPALGLVQALKPVVAQGAAPPLHGDGAKDPASVSGPDSSPIAMLPPSSARVDGLELVRILTVDYEGTPRSSFSIAERGVYINVFVKNATQQSDSEHWISVRCLDPQGRPYGRIIGGTFHLEASSKPMAREVLRPADPRHHNGYLIHGNEIAVRPGAYTVLVEVDGKPLGRGSFTVTAP